MKMMQMIVGSGKGKGKGKGKISPVRKAAKNHPEKCVWIGGLQERETRTDSELNKKLKEWIEKQCEGCKFVDIGKRGSGGAIFNSEDEASTALAQLNGKKFQGRKLEFD